MSEEPQKSSWGKSVFVFITVAFCLSVAAAMGFDQTLTTKVSEIVADGLISLSLFVAVSYLAAQAVDSSTVSRMVGSRLRGFVPAQPVTPPTPQYQTVDPNDYVDPAEAKG